MFGNDNMFGAGGVSTGFYDTTIDQSLRFNDNDSARLQRTFSAGNRRTWTFSTWVKRGNIGSRQTIFQVNSDTTGTTGVSLEFYSSDRLYLWIDHSGYWSVPTTSQVFRDTSAWYHIVLTMDTTQSTASNRTKLYINGELAPITFEYSTTYISQNADLYVNAARSHNLGVRQRATSTYDLYADLYMADTYLVDGQALTADSFGEFKSGVWIPKAYSGSYGTNGFHLEFADSGSLGADTSGNGNTWSAYNLASTDQMLDSPTNNFCTWNPTYQYVNTAGPEALIDGNLVTGTTSSAQYGYVTSTIAPSSGKWYCEAIPTTTTTSDKFGIVSTQIPASKLSVPDQSYVVAYYKDGGNIYEDDSQIATTSSSFTTNDKIGLAVDLDSNTIEFYKNGTSVGSATFSRTGSWFIGCFSDGRNSLSSNWRINYGQDSSFAGLVTAQGNTDANGIGDFYYAPPAGYLALCTSNLPEPVIGPNSDSTSDENFNTVLWTGNNTQPRSITGVGFQPDLVWTKVRTTSYSNTLYDVLRSPDAALFTDTTGAEQEPYNHGVLDSFDADGFTVNSGPSSNIVLNESGRTYVAWNWKAGASGVSNTDGSITSTVSANTDAGFSIVSYTGTGSATTIGHGLDNAPDMIICKQRSGNSNWTVYHADVGASKYLSLNLTNGTTTDTRAWNNTAPTATVFSLADFGSSNAGGYTHIAYCFHSVDGFSKFGSYTGNGSNDGPFVYTGFRPAFVMVKHTNASGDHWRIMDNTRQEYNPEGPRLRANTSDAESNDSSSYPKDFLSNGFKIRHTGSGENASGGTYIYMAFAENPFKYSNAR